MPGDTRKLNKHETDTLASQEITSLDIGMPRPWRIALRILQKENRLIFDMSNQMVIGRMVPEMGFYPDIDLGPYNAEELGVSRQHLTLKLEGERILAMDNGSANGTLLNNERMKPREDYPIRDGDEISLGLMKVKVELLMNPFN